MKTKTLGLPPCISLIAIADAARVIGMAWFYRINMPPRQPEKRRAK